MAEYYSAKFVYTAQSADELSMQAGDLIPVCEKSADGFALLPLHTDPIVRAAGTTVRCCPSTRLSRQSMAGCPPTTSLVPAGMSCGAGAECAHRGVTKRPAGGVPQANGALQGWTGQAGHRAEGVRLSPVMAPANMRRRTVKLTIKRMQEQKRKRLCPYPATHTKHFMQRSSTASSLQQVAGEPAWTARSRACRLRRVTCST